MAGEIIGHARSALDHAVWGMVPRRTRRTSSFPVFTCEPKYDQYGVRRIDGINAEAAAIIRAEQPFGPNHSTSLLYILNKLWNVDKHRSLNFCAAYPVAVMIYYGRPAASTKLEARRVPIPADVKDGEELFRERRPGPNVEVIAEIASTGVVFDGDPVNREPVPSLLLKLIQFSDRIINSLAQTI